MGRRVGATRSTVSDWNEALRAGGLEALKRRPRERNEAAVRVGQLPGYAPELNPTEYIWGHLKQHELANQCASTFAALKTTARNRLRSMQRRPSLICAL